MNRWKEVTKKNYYSNMLNNTPHSKLWKNLNSILGRAKTNDKISLVINNTHTNNKQEVCQSLNDYFTKSLAANNSYHYKYLHCSRRSLHCFNIVCNKHSCADQCWEDRSIVKHTISQICRICRTIFEFNTSIPGIFQYLHSFLFCFVLGSQ